MGCILCQTILSVHYPSCIKQCDLDGEAETSSYSQYFHLYKKLPAWVIVKSRKISLVGIDCLGPGVELSFMEQL